MKSAAAEILGAIYELELEFGLTIALSLDCSCKPYLINRREVLFDHILRQADKEGLEPVAIFGRFAKRLHERNCERD